MIVAVMKSLRGENANGRRIPRPMSTAANAHFDHAGRESRTAWILARRASRHSRYWAISSSTSSRLPGLLAEQAARLQDHDQDQIGEDDRRRPLRPEARVGELLDDPDDDAA